MKDDPNSPQLLVDPILEVEASPEEVESYKVVETTWLPFVSPPHRQHTKPGKAVPYPTHLDLTFKKLGISILKTYTQLGFTNFFKYSQSIQSKIR